MCAARLRIKNIDPHMPVDLKRPGRGEHEQCRMGIEHGFLQANRAQAERVAHHHHGEFGQHDVEAAPHCGPADGGIDAIDRIGDGLGDLRDRVSHGHSQYYNVARNRGNGVLVMAPGPITMNIRTTDHEHGSELSEMQLRVRALETVLAEKGYIDPAAHRRHHRGLRDQGRPPYRRPRRRQGLERSGVQAGAYRGRQQSGAGARPAQPRRRSSYRGREHAELHNMIVCTLCSCYPWEVLGLPPVWYKAAPYRSRAVNDPRGVLADFGVKLPADTDIRVWDSTAETRFIVLPMRPAGTEGWSEEKLATLVTRDCMIGTGLPRQASEVA